MSASLDSGSGFGLTPRAAIARRQLTASIGALVAVALIATAAALTVRVSSAPIAVAEASHGMLVKAAVRQVPSRNMQATDQARSDRGS